MSSDDYNEARKDASGSGVIYDVPVGADYKEFQKNVQKKAEELHLENFQMRALAYATSALSAENRYIFGMCEASKGGLYVASGKMGTDNYQISIYYKPAINAFDIRGHVGGSSNIEATSLRVLKREVAAKNFGYVVWMEPVPSPQNKMVEAALEIVVGQTAKSVLLPPLSVFGAVFGRYAVSAGRQAVQSGQTRACVHMLVERGQSWLPARVWI